MLSGMRSSHQCFNPRPALLPGESPAASSVAILSQVSIRARHYCQANLPIKVISQEQYNVSIRARHYCQANQ